MKGTTHFIVGLVSAELMMRWSNIDPSVGDVAAISAFCVLGAMFPDIDHRQSKITNSSAATKVIGRSTNMILGHRGPVHTPIVCVILTLFLKWLFNDMDFSSLTRLTWFSDGIIQYLPYAFAVGFMSHLVMDTFNPAGISWFYPLSKKKLSLLPITSGGVIDSALSCMAVLVMMVLGSGKL